RDAYPEGCQARRTAGRQPRKFELVIKSEDREGPRIHNCDSSCWHRPMRSSNDDSVAWGPNGDPFARLAAKVRYGATPVARKCSRDESDQLNERVTGTERR